MNGYVVTRPHQGSGVGSNLSSLAGALWLAQRLRRTLLVDWRGQPELADDHLNYFPEFFSLPDAVGGVEIISVPNGDAPFAPEDANVRWLEPGEARTLGADGAAPAMAEYLALRSYHGLSRIHAGSESERFRFLRAFYRALKPQPDVAAAIDRWIEANLSEFGFVIGLHVRTGNGSADFAPGGPYAQRIDMRLLNDERRFSLLIERARTRIADRFPRELRMTSAVFYTTDSAAMSTRLARLPNAITRRTVFPPVGVDHAYAFPGPAYTARDGVIDTLADLFLLARCDGLVYNASLFSEYARVVTGYFGGNQVHFEALPLRKRSRHALGELRRRIM